MSYPAYGSYPPYGRPVSPPLGFMEALRLGWARKFTAEGRSRRSEYWWVALGTAIVETAAYVVAAILFVVGSAIGHGVEVLTGIVAVLVFAVAFIAVLLVQVTEHVRRLHDTDKSGWWALLLFVPVASLVVFVFSVMDSTPGPNRFGPSPKDVAGLPSGDTSGAMYPSGPAGGAPSPYGEGWGGPVG